MANEQRTDLISRKALIAEYDRVHIGPPGGARKLMEEAPAVDAVEVVHGRWIHKHFDDVCGGWYNEWHCSVCNGRVYEKGFNYCPNCGAKMDGGNEDA